MADGISIREFARRDGCSDALVRRAIKEGRIKALPDKSLDPALVGTGWRKGNADAANGANKSAHRAAPPRAAPAQQIEPAYYEVFDDETPTEAAHRIASVDGVPSHDYAEALRRKENFLALLRQLEYQVKSGALIELEVAQAVVFEMFRGQRDSWMNWPTRVGPKLAADLGLEADRVTEILTAYVHEHISELGEPDPQFAGGEG